MKRSITLLLAILMGTMLMAQPPEGSQHKKHRRPEPPKVEEMVSNLSSLQKKRLEGISENCKKQTTKLQKELDETRTQIRNLMMQDGDQSDKLFPLIDRESSLQAQIAKEMYRTRVQIDQVLTEEQLTEFRARCKADRQKHHQDTNREKQHNRPAKKAKRQ
jgi:Spy/CpxP family protein refolding chaperone